MRVTDFCYPIGTATVIPIPSRYFVGTGDIDSEGDCDTGSRVIVGAFGKTREER